MHVQIIVSRKDSHNQKLLSPMTNHRGQGKSEAHGQQFGQFNRVAFKERSEAAFDRQTSYRRELEESFRYQNTLSNGTTQERAAMMLELRDTEHNRQQQIEASLRQVEQLRLQREEAQKLALAEEDKQAIENERKQKRGLSQGIG
jgi:hypothetical protein